MSRCYAARGPGTVLQPFQYTEEPLGPLDVRIEVTHCGVCHSDIHLIDDDWSIGAYPLVPGHEIVGEVVEHGPQVDHLRVGQRVGVGWQRGACLACEFCLRGDENLCPGIEETCVGHQGGYAETVAVDSRFAFPIPDALPSDNAAPLFCAGITVYAALRVFGVQPPMRVGVIGLGGLGHLAVQFAAAFGCEVAVFSSSSDKERDARHFGASAFHSSIDSGDLALLADSLDLILSTAPVDLDWGAYLRLLRPDGRLCFVGVPPSPVSLPMGSLLGGRNSVCASFIGGRPLIGEMLQFAARHGIRAQVEGVPLAQVNTALDRVRQNRARYRMVLTT
jgi:alcohol/geraniol dehydrogenase (NADP+)